MIESSLLGIVEDSIRNSNLINNVNEFNELGLDVMVYFPSKAAHLVGEINQNIDRLNNKRYLFIWSKEIGMDTFLIKGGKNGYKETTESISKTIDIYVKHIRSIRRSSIEEEMSFEKQIDIYSDLIEKRIDPIFEYHKKNIFKNISFNLPKGPYWYNCSYEKRIINKSNNNNKIQKDEIIEVFDMTIKSRINTEKSQINIANYIKSDNVKSLEERLVFSINRFYDIENNIF